MNSGLVNLQDHLSNKNQRFNQINCSITMKIYVASSWRNEKQPEVVRTLRAYGHQVYDFKNPPTCSGFGWHEIDPDWQKWNNEQYLRALTHPIADRGFGSDFQAMIDADACVLVLPCGRSAHSEAGWMQGHGKPTLILLPEEPEEPELMYKMFEMVTTGMDQILSHLELLELAASLDPE